MTRLNKSNAQASALLNAVGESLLVTACLMWSAFACGMAAGAVGILLLIEAAGR